MYFLCGQEVWSEPSMGARMVPANGQTTKTKKIFGYMSFWLERLHLITNIYICVQFLFSKRGACFYWVPCFYWDIYGILHEKIYSQVCFFHKLVKNVIFFWYFCRCLRGLYVTKFSRKWEGPSKSDRSQLSWLGHVQTTWFQWGRTDQHW